MKSVGTFLEVPFDSVSTAAFLPGPLGLCCDGVFLANSELFVVSRTILQMERDCCLVL